MARNNRLVSFLDRFEEQLEVCCSRLKHSLVERVDGQLGVMRTKVREVKNRFGARAGHVRVTNADHTQLTDDPQVDTVSLDQCLRQQRAAHAQHQTNMPSTTTGSKRASQSQAESIASKKRKPNPNGINQANKFVCKFMGCQQSLSNESNLVIHEHIHLGIKPYSCTWPNCIFSSPKRGNVVCHVRMKHFKLPKSQKEQQQLNIVDERDPNEFVQVDTQLAGRRLE